MTIQQTDLVQAADQSEGPEINAKVRKMADLMHRLNHAIAQVVDAGGTVELMRCSRHHGGNGSWGDQMQPIVTIKEASAG